MFPPPAAIAGGRKAL